MGRRRDTKFDNQEDERRRRDDALTNDYNDDARKTMNL